MKNSSLQKGWTALLYVFLMGVYLSCPTTFAQNTNSLQNITGIVSDANGVLPGVTITVKGKSVSSISDANGSYSILAEPNDVLVFSFIGYKEVAVAVSVGSSINVTLQEDATTLKEVTVNAGYYKVKDKERTGSISKITSKDIETQPVTNVLAAMQGRMSGVSITQTTGVPGGGFAIQIRGQSSLRSTGNDPLYIIDGIPYSSEAIGSSSTSNILAGLTSPLNSLNPDTIESIEVLKDADATAIYGSRGANGVVLITTKKGKAGKTRFTGTLLSGAGRVTRFMDLMNTEQYLAMRREAYANDGVTTYPSNAYDVNGTWDQTRYTDWQKVLTGGTAEITNINTSVSGGSAQTQFLISGNFSKQTTVFPGDFFYKKVNVHFNLNHQSDNKKFKVVFSGGYTVQDNNQPYTDITRESRLIAPNAPALYDADGNLNWENNTFTNPLRQFNGEYMALTYDLLGNGILSYQLLKDVEVKSTFGFSDLRHEESNTAPSTLYNPAYGIGSSDSVLFLNNADRQTWIIEPQVNWNRTFGKAAVSVLAGGTFQTQSGAQMVQQALGFPSNSLIHNIAASSNVSITQNDQSEYRYQAFFGRANFIWDEKYILNLTGRRDGSSRFGPGKQFSTFGAFGAAWLFSNETVLKDSKILSFGKLRVSYGTTGNDQIGDYQYLDTYTTTGVTYDGITGLEPSRLYNPKFGWETNKKFEIALETGFLKDRLFLTAGWYKNRSSDQLVGIPLPGTTGFESLQANLNATVENRGLELTLRTQNFQGTDFSWSTSFNFSTSKNKLVSFPGLEASTYRYQFIVGQPLNIVKVYQFTGINPTTGIYEFQDFNGDGVISETDDKQAVKDLNPQFYGGLQNQFKYKQFQLDFLFQFVKQENYNALASFPMPGRQNNQPTAVIDHWQNSGDDATHQVYSVSNSTVRNAYFQYTESTASISDASYIRLKNVSLSYDLPKGLLKDVHCRLSLQGENLLTFTKFNGADPEFKYSDYLPPLKIFTAGIQITF